MMRKLPLHTTIFIGMILGGLFGWLLPNAVSYISWIGDLFLRLLKLMVIPLIFVSLVDGVSKIGNAGRLSALGFKTSAYYLATNLLAVFVSLILVNLIQPGAGMEIFGKASDLPSGNFSINTLVPKNFFQPFVEGSSLQIVFLAIFIGIGAVLLTDRTATFRKFFEEANAVVLKLTEIIIKMAPIGVFALIAKMVGSLDASVMAGIGKFALTIILALLIHGGVTLVIIFKFFSKRSLKDFFHAAKPALLSAFSTSSSAATLPITMNCMEKGAGIEKEKVGFVLPIGATVNMDGTAMYEAIACLFVAQAVGVDLSIIQQLIVFLTATLAAVGAAAIPSAGLVTLAMVLSAVNLPLEGIGFLLALDRPFDMSRTTVNVWGDMVGCAVVEGTDKD